MKSIFQMELIEAAKNNDVYALREAIASGVDLDSIDECGNTALIHASRLNFLEIVIELLEKGASIEFTGNYMYKLRPLMYAAAKGNLAVVRELIARGADVNATDEFHDTPMMFATSRRHSKVVIELLEGGADPEIRNEGNYTALDIAKSKSYDRVIQVLINYAPKKELVKRLYSNGVSEEVSKWCGSFLV